MRIREVVRLLSAGTLVVAAGACISAGPAPARFLVTEFDLCERLDLSPLEPLSLTVWEEGPHREAEFDDGSTNPEWVDAPGTCTFGMRTAAGYHADLSVLTFIEESAAAAESRYERHAAQTQEPEGPVAGLGDQALAYVRESESDLGMPHTAYEILARADTLVVTATLGIAGAEPAPAGTLAEPTRAIVDGTIAAVPPAPLPSPIPRRAMAYDTADFDVCAETDLDPFAELGLALDGPPVPRYRDDALPESVGCGFWLASEEEPSFRSVYLDLQARGHRTLTTAESHYVSGVEFQLRHSGWSHAGSPAGLGDRADAAVWTEAFEDLPDQAWLEYQLSTLHGNLVVRVALLVSDEVEVAQETLAGVARDIAAGTLARVPLVPAT